MRHVIRKLREEKASAMVENVIIMPVIFVVIYSFILTAFIIHDRSTIEAAAQRGAIYAAHCISDPNYASIVGQSGELDVPESKEFCFDDVGDNIEAYRYIFGGDSVEDIVTLEVQKIVQKTRINWYPQEQVEVTVDQKNMFIYQDVTVTVSSVYKIPEFFAAFGLETEYKNTATATISTTDPDEFIRNADLVVDIIADIDVATGGHIGNAIDKIGELGKKVLDWFNVGK